MRARSLVVTTLGFVALALVAWPQEGPAQRPGAASLRIATDLAPARASFRPRRPEPDASPFYLTSQSDDFASGNLIDAVGETAEANLNPAAAYGNAYTVHFYVWARNVSLTLAIDANDGSGWVQRDNVSYTNCGGGGTWSHEQRTVTVSGLGLNDDVRIRAISAAQCGSSPAFAVRGGDAGGVNPETYNGVTYTTDTVTTTWPQSDDFESGNLMDASGETAEAHLDPAGATGNSYTLHYYVTVSRVSLTLAIDANDGSGWVERATVSYSNCGGTSEWLHEQRTVVVSGLGLNDDLRLRVVSAPPCSGPPNTFAVRGGDGTGSNPESYSGVTYTSSSVLVTPDGEPVVVPAGSGFQQQFAVLNLDSVSRIYTVVGACSGAASGCTTAPAQLTVPGRQAGTATVTYSTSGAVGATGAITVTATVQGAPSANDAGSVLVAVAPKGPVVDRGLCLTIAVGSSAASECGDLRIVHPLPSVRTLNRVRTPTLVYNSQLARPRPVVTTDVTLSAAADSVRATLTIGSLGAQSRTWPGAQFAVGSPRRLGVAYDPGPSVGTNLYPYTLQTQRYNTGTGWTTLTTTSDTVAIVNRVGSPFGAGWWLAGFEQLYFPTGGGILWVGGDGSVRRYISAGSNTYIAAPVDRPDTLIYRPADTTYVRLLAGGDSVVFGSNGFHRRTANRLGYRTEFVADGSGRLWKIRVPPQLDSLVYTFTYGSSAGRLSQVLAPDTAGGTGRVTVIGTTGTRITSIQDPGTSALVQFGHLSGADSVRVGSRRDRRNQVTFYNFDSAGRLRESKLGLSAAANDTIRVTLPAIAQTRGLSSQDAIAQHPDSIFTRLDGPRTDSVDVTTFWLTLMDGVRQVRDPYGFTSTVTRADARWPGLPTRTQAPNGRIMSATYDARGNLAAVADSNPYNNGLHPTTRFVWHQRWDELRLVTLPNGQITRFDINTANGNINYVEDARGATTRTSLTYVPSGNGAGLLNTVTEPGGATTRYHYDWRGNLDSIEAQGWPTRMVSDRLGRPRLVQSPAGASPTDNRWRTDSTAYNARGWIIRSVAVGDTTPGVARPRLTASNTFDGEGNVTMVQRTQSPNPTSLTTLTTEWQFDAANRPIVEIAPDGYLDSTQYDLGGNVTRRRTRRAHVVTMDYDRMNRLVRRVVPGVVYPQRNGPGLLSTLSLMYDNYPATHPYPWFPNSGGGLGLDTVIDTFRYNSVGQLILADNGDARVRRGYFKDGSLQVDSLSIRNYVGSSSGHLYVQRYTYDINGRLIALRHPAQLATGTGMRDSVRYVYNDTTGALATVYTLLGNAINFLYNTRGELIRTSLPGGISDTLGYDLLGRLTLDRVRNLSSSAQRDPDSLLRNTTFQYADHMRVSSALNNHGWKDTAYALYDPLGHLSFLSYARPQNTADSALYLQWRQTASQSSTFDPLGNAYSTYASSSGDIGYGSSFSQGSNGGAYFASATSRVDSTFDGGGRHVLVYDSSGNTVFSYQSAGSSTLNDRASFYGADGRLRVAERRAAWNDGMWQNPAWHVVFDEYRYDALGRRVLVMSRQDCLFGGDSTALKDCQMSRIRRTVWAGDRELWEIQMPARTGAYLENDTATVTDTAYTNWQNLYSDPNPLWGRVAYTYAGALDRPVSITRVKLVRRKTPSDTRYWNPTELQPNWNWRGQAEIGTFHDGGMRTCTDASHCVYVQWRSVAFAVGLAEELLWWPRGLLQGYQSPVGWFGTLITDKEDGAGTFYRRNRVVDPMTGRFTQEDPLGLAGGLNLYGFASGDPITFSDPFGLCPELPCRSDDDPMRDRPLPEGVDERDVTWDPSLGRGRGGYRHDVDGREILPIPETPGGWDRWQIYDPDTGRQWAEPGDWSKPGFNPKVPASPTDPWARPSQLDRFMDWMLDEIDHIVRSLPKAQPWMLPPIPGLAPFPMLPGLY